MTRLRIHFFGKPHDLFGLLIHIGGRLTGRTTRFTHVAIGFPDAVEETEHLLFHYVLGGVEWTDMLDQLKNFRRHEFIDIETPHELDSILSVCYGLSQNGRGTTLLGLFRLFFGKDTPNVCTAAVNTIRFRFPFDSAPTPDELYDLFETLYGSEYND